MKDIILLLFLILIALSGCRRNRKVPVFVPVTQSPTPDPAPTPVVCDTFVFNDNIVARTYQGTTVTTVGDCGEEYDAIVPVDYFSGWFVANVNSGWKFDNAYLSTSGGNVNFSTGGRWMLSTGRIVPDNEGAGLTFAGIDHTTCQNDSAQNGVADLFLLEVTAEFDSDCVTQLRGTFREYSRCVDSSEVTICSGTITLVR